MGQGYFSALEKTRKRKNSKTIPSKYSINHLMRLKDNIMNDLDNSIFLDDVPIKSKQKEDGDILPTLKDGASNRQSNATSKNQCIVPNSSIKLTKND